MDQDVINLAKAIRQRESGGNFNAVGDAGTSKGGYQWQAGTWKEHARNVLGDENAEMTQDNQQAVAYGTIKSWKDKGLNPAQIAAKWNSGKSEGWENKVGITTINGKKLKYDVPAYVKEVTDTYQSFKTASVPEPVAPVAPEQQAEKGDGFFKSLVKAPLTMLARPIQLGAELLMPGDNTEAIDKFSEEKLGGFVAPIPKNFSDLKKDVGRGVQTAAFGLPGLASGGAAFGVGASLEQGNDLFSTETAFQTALGIGGGKVLGLVGKPILNVAGKVVGKITPQIIKDVASKGVGAMEKFASTHNILPPNYSKALTTGADKLENVVNKPFEIAGNQLGKAKAAYTKNKDIKTINDREQEIFNIENNYSKTRKAMAFSKDANSSSRRRIAETDVLANAVDKEGKLITKDKGGAVDQYYDQTLKGKEGVVKQNLKNEGASVSPDIIRNKLRENVMKSGLEGESLTKSLSSIDKEVEGLMLRATPDGKIPLEIVHDAKISTTQGINFMTEPHIKTKSKSFASAYKRIVEENSKLPIENINKELAKYYQDIALLKNLDGRRVKGGRLGKYFAQISGNIIGGTAGAAVGGPFGSAVGTIIGGELGGAIKGNVLSRTLGGKTGAFSPKNTILEEALNSGQAPRLPLPAPKAGAFRTQQGSGKTINLPSRSQSPVLKDERINMKINREPIITETQILLPERAGAIELPESVTAQRKLLEQIKLGKNELFNAKVRNPSDRRKIIKLFEDKLESTYSNNLGNRNTKYNTTKTTNKNPIPDSIPQKPGAFSKAKPNSASDAVAKGLTEEQWMKGQGTVLYHGGPEKFDDFSYDKLGKGGGSNQGIGFYFTRDKKIAQEYTNKKGVNLSTGENTYQSTNTSNVLEAVVDLKNPIIIDSNQKSIGDIFSKEQFIKIAESGDEKVLGLNRLKNDAYNELFPKFKTKKEIEEAVDKLSKSELYDIAYKRMSKVGLSGSHNGISGFQEYLRHGFYRYDSAEKFLNNFVDITGYDGVIDKMVLRDLGAGTSNDVIVSFTKKNIKTTSQLRTEYQAAKPNSASDAVAKGLTEEQYVKGQGTPLYHGTNQDFNAFSNASRGNSTKMGSAKRGTFFTDSPTEAKSYADFADSNLVANEKAFNKEVNRLTKLQAEAERRAQTTRNPSDWKKSEDLTQQLEDFYLEETRDNVVKNAKVIEAYSDLKNPMVYDFAGAGAKDSTSGDISELIKQARKNGNDGLIMKNIVDDPGKSGIPTTHTVVFDSKNIKTTSQLRTEYQAAKLKTSFGKLTSER